MRKLIVVNLMSLDGYVAGPGGDVGVLPLDDSFSAYNLDRMRTADTLVLGRSTYEMLLSYWPGVDADDTQSDVEREISRVMAVMGKVVVSDSLAAEAAGPWRDTTLVVPRAGARARIAALKQVAGGDLLTFGSVTLWNDLLAGGLVDELHLTIGNGVLTAGLPAFSVPVTGRLPLLEVRRLPDSDNVLLVYAAPLSA